MQRQVEELDPVLRDLVFKVRQRVAFEFASKHDDAEAKAWHTEFYMIFNVPSHWANNGWPQSMETSWHAFLAEMRRKYGGKS